MLTSIISIILLLALVLGILYGAVMVLLELASIGPYGLLALVCVVLCLLGYSDYTGQIQLPQHFWRNLGGGALCLLLLPYVISYIVLPLARPFIAVHRKMFALLLGSKTTITGSQ